MMALTAHAFAENERQTLEAGCSEHLTKPITKPRLLEAIARYAVRKEGGSPDFFDSILGCEVFYY
ncbi:MAG: hypothetical protein H7839_10135 [Magnetococcus sp. YQC-5]